MEWRPSHEERRSSRATRTLSRAKRRPSGRRVVHPEQIGVPTVMKDRCIALRPEHYPGIGSQRANSYRQCSQVIQGPYSKRPFRKAQGPPGLMRALYPSWPSPKVKAATALVSD